MSWALKVDPGDCKSSHGITTRGNLAVFSLEWSKWTEDFMRVSIVVQVHVAQREGVGFKSSPAGGAPLKARSSNDYRTRARIQLQT